MKILKDILKSRRIEENLSQQELAVDTPHG